MPTYRLTLEYDGARYRGWQEQVNARTVAGELRRAIEAVVGQKGVDLGGSGRTDAGVHALAQVAHLRLARRQDPGALRRGINEALPPDIHVLSVRLAADRFHARHHALVRSYLYQISLRRSAFAKRYVWWVKAPLDLARLEEAAALLPGRRDFARFCERPADQASTLVEVERVEVGRAGALVLVRLEASHFLWKMVRRLVGTLVEVGAERLSRPAFEALLLGSEVTGAEAAAGPAAWTAPPSGLFLERVLYAGDPPLAPLAPAFPVAAEPGDGPGERAVGQRRR